MFFFFKQKDKEDDNNLDNFIHFLKKHIFSLYPSAALIFTLPCLFSQLLFCKCMTKEQLRRDIPQRQEGNHGKWSEEKVGDGKKLPTPHGFKKHPSCIL